MTDKYKTKFLPHPCERWGAGTRLEILGGPTQGGAGAEPDHERHILWIWVDGEHVARTIDLRSGAIAARQLHQALKEFFDD
jgi:hypothetical protein